MSLLFQTLTPGEGGNAARLGTAQGLREGDFAFSELHAGDSKLSMPVTPDDNQQIIKISLSLLFRSTDNTPGTPFFFLARGSGSQPARGVDYIAYSRYEPQHWRRQRWQDYLQPRSFVFYDRPGTTRQTFYFLYVLKLRRPGNPPNNPNGAILLEKGSSMAFEKLV